VAERSSVFGAHTYSSVTLDGLNHIWQSISISSDTPDSDIDRYNVGRQLMSSDERLCDGSSKWAKDRLAECASSHQLCQSQSGDSFLPTRLINLQPGWKGLDVRLEDSHSVRSGSLYVALSYCWGHHRPACITTLETLARNKTRIPWDALPLTFQDAAAFTLSLGVQYLWIDSICIIQEDEKDWQQEAGKMYAAYKNSYLTLAALTGRDSTSGLRNMSIRQDSVLLAKLRIYQAIYPLYLRRNHYLDGVDAGNIKGSFADTCRRYPLLSRAWAFQERTISPHVIFFTESEMIFMNQDQDGFQNIPSHQEIDFLEYQYQDQPGVGSSFSYAVRTRIILYTRERGRQLCFSMKWVRMNKVRATWLKTGLRAFLKVKVL
jgi:hypothetical protein